MLSLFPFKILMQSITFPHVLPSPRKAWLPPPVHCSAVRRHSGEKTQSWSSYKVHPVTQRPSLASSNPPWAACRLCVALQAAGQEEAKEKFSNAGQRAGWKITSPPWAVISTSSCDYHVSMRGETCKLRAKTFFMSSTITVPSFLLPVMGMVAQPFSNSAADPACRLLCRTVLRCRTAPCSQLYFANSQINKESVQFKERLLVIAFFYLRFMVYLLSCCWLYSGLLIMLLNNCLEGQRGTTFVFIN